MEKFLYTTHSRDNPLIQALISEGIVVRHLTMSDALGDLSGCMGFYGNLFDEIKQWRWLVTLRSRLAARGVPYIFWNRDAPWNTGMKFRNRLAMQWLKPVDIYLTHSMQSYKWFGGEAHYFPNAARPQYYRDTDLSVLRTESNYRYDISFFGSYGKIKDRNARERQAFLIALEDRLKQSLPGIRFKSIDTSCRSLSLMEQLELIRTSKININFGAMCDLPNNPSWGLPERVFGIPAAGGFLLTDNRKSLSQTLANEACGFSCLEECEMIVKNILPYFEFIRDRAEALHVQVMDRHTYANRASYLLNLLSAYQTNVA